ncbi:MAG: hypothetical protein R3B47_09580 [Bacteroidia bacterium]
MYLKGWAFYVSLFYEKVPDYPLCLFLVTGSLHAVSIFLDYARFQNPNAEPYIEVYITVDGSSVNYQAVEGQKAFQAKVELNIFLLKLESNGDTSLQYVDKYNLLSPVTKDTSMSARKAFPDLKRIMTPPGMYALRVIARDKFGDSETDHLTVIEVPEPEKEAFSFSDIELSTR